MYIAVLPLGFALEFPFEKWKNIVLSLEIKFILVIFYQF